MQIFKQQRKTEPTSIHRCRVLTMIFIIALLCVYAVILTHNVVHDIPILTTKVQTAKSLPLPTLSFVYAYNFIISCWFVYNLTIDETCTKYVQQPTFTNNAYAGSFKPTLDLQMVPPTNTKELTMMMFIMTVTDTRFKPNDTDISQMVFTLTDTETAMEADRRIIDTDEIDNIDPNFGISLIDQSMYTMFYHQKNLVDYVRNTRNIIRPSLFTDFGFSPSTISISYLTSRLSSGPMLRDDTMINPNVYGSIVIKPSSFLVRTDTEMRSNTVLGSLGSLGGAWSLALIAYATLFGSKSLTPWGLIHSYCCCFVRSNRSRFRESFSIIPLQSSSSSTSDLSILSSDLSYNNNALQQRLDALELFLKEYVVDQTYLEDLNANKYSNKISEFLGNWTWKSRKRNDSSTSDATLPQVSSTENDSSTIDTTQPQVSSTDSPNIRDISNYQLAIPNLHNDNTLL